MYRWLRDGGLSGWHIWHLCGSGLFGSMPTLHFQVVFSTTAKTCAQLVDGSSRLGSAWLVEWLLLACCMHAYVLVDARVVAAGVWHARNYALCLLAHSCFVC